MEKLSNNCLIYFQITNWDQNKESTYIKYLSPDRKNRVNSSSPQNKPLLIFSEILIRIVASKLLNIDYCEATFSHNSYGKPYLSDYPNFHFNISHSNDTIVLLVSDSPVGVDIEYINEPCLKIVDRFFLEEEKDYINSDNNNKSIRFYEIWTRKEAFIKYLGKGLSIPLNSFNVFDSSIAPHFKTYYIDDYVISSFYKNCDSILAPIQITEMEINSFLNNISIDK